MATHRQREPRFLWAGLLVLLPVVALCGIGLWGLGKDKAEAFAEARRWAAEKAERVAYAGDLFLRGGGGSMSQQLDLSGAPYGCKIYSDPPEPVANPSPVAAELDALYADGTMSAEEKARVAYKMGGRAEGYTSGGLPLSVMIRHASLKWAIEAEMDADALEDRAGVLGLYAIKDASVVTPRMLELAKPYTTEKTRLRWDERWERDERFRSFYRQHRETVDELVGELLSMLRLYRERVRRWLPADGDQEELLCTVTHAGSAMHVTSIGLSEIEAVMRSSRTWPKGDPNIPDYLGARLWIDGRLIASQRASESADVIAVHRVGDAVRAEVVLADEGAMLAPVAERTRRTATVIGLAAFAALVGWFAAWRAFEKQQRLSQMKDNFVSAVSHELKAPVAAIGLMAEEMERGDGKREEYAALIAGECARLGSLVENVLDDARFAQGREAFEFDDTDIGDLVRATADVLRPAAAKRGMEIEVEAPAAGELTGMVDARALGRAVVNLLDNAIKYAPENTVVEVGAAANNGKIEIVVADRGEELSAVETRRLFDRFYRGGNELTRETQGVGIGLSLVRRIAEAHGGRAFAVSGAEGNRFGIEIVGRDSCPSRDGEGGGRARIPSYKES